MNKIKFYNMLNDILFFVLETTTLMGVIERDKSFTESATFALVALSIGILMMVRGQNSFSFVLMRVRRAQIIERIKSKQTADKLIQRYILVCPLLISKMHSKFFCFNLWTEKSVLLFHNMKSFPLFLAFKSSW